MYHDLKKHRLSSKKFFLVYPKTLMKNGKLVELTSFDIRATLCPIFMSRQIRAFIVYEQCADAYYPYDYLCTFILLKRVKNIVNPTILNINGILGSYSTVITPVFHQCNVSNVHYFTCLDDMSQKSNNELICTNQSDVSIKRSSNSNSANNSHPESNLKDKLIRNLIVSI
uniref:Uncharacterized protein n=1 Tax=Gracilaria vermiculophylla TaxID=2608709 RepID=A0A346Q013_9FLOR|nr:hypothetical protein [Gracilaria vermiculophylla]